MRYRTVNIRLDTYERLRILRVGGKSFDDVIDDLIETVDPELYHGKALEEHRRRL